MEEAMAETEQSIQGTQASAAPAERFDEAFLFLEAGSDPAVDRIVNEHAGGRTVFVFAPDAAAAALVAGELAEGGVRLIELHRGFSLHDAAAVIEAVGGRAPVGVASYSPGVVPAPGARNWATIYGDESADPAAARVVHEQRDGGRTTIVGAPDAATEQVAVELVRAGADVVVVCGGTPLTTAARVAAAVGDSAAVAQVSWPVESIDGAVAYKAAFEASEASV
jgi:NADPH-dependent ferric siderophore reductase